MATLEIKLVQDADGLIDIDRTLLLAQETVLEFKASRETEETTILGHLNTVFDTLKAGGTKANMPYVIGQVLTLMNISAMPSSYKTLETRVHKYIQANSQGKTIDKVTKQVERPNSMFVIGKGKGGGLYRRSDLTAAEVVAEQV
jgi:hypothetical protein